MKKKKEINDSNEYRAKSGFSFLLRLYLVLRATRGTSQHRELLLGGKKGGRRKTVRRRRLGLFGSLLGDFFECRKSSGGGGETGEEEGT